MLTLIAIILICSAMSDFAAASDWEASEHAAERRHEELMEVTRKKALKKRSTPKITRRRFIKDKHGNILAEEIIVDNDYYDDYDEIED